jgi:HEXXH motif-containing protein
VAAPFGVADGARRALLDRLEGVTAGPGVHALFHTLVHAVQAEDWANGREAVARLLALDPGRRPELEAIPFDAASLGQGMPEVFARLADIEERNRLDLTAAPPDDVQRFQGMLAEARRLLAASDPELLGEFEALVTEIYLVSQKPGHRFTLGALSCFETWGGLFVAPAIQRDALDLVGTLAHECTHFLLFAFATEGPLTLNPPGDRHYSALRDEMRSMDGVYHATLVASRMSAAFQRQLSGGRLGPELEPLALQRLAVARDYFELGVAEIEEHGRLSPLGEDLLEQAHRLLAPPDPSAARPVRKA